MSLSKLNGDSMGNAVRDGVRGSKARGDRRSGVLGEPAHEERSGGHDEPHAQYR